MGKLKTKKVKSLRSNSLLSEMIMEAIEEGELPVMTVIHI